MAIIYTNSFRFLPNAYDPFFVSLSPSSCTRIAGRFPGGYGYGTRTDITSSSEKIVRILATLSTNLISCSIGFAHYAMTARRWFQIGTGAYYDAIFFPYNGAPSATAASGSSTWTIHDSTPVPNGWQWFCIQVIPNSAASGFIKVYVNGVLIASKGPDTLPSSPYERGIELSVGTNTVNEYGAIGDVVISDDPNYLIPDSRVDMLLPNADVGAVWTPSTGTSLFPLVADSGGPSLNADYISSGTVGAHQQFDLENLPHNPSTVLAVATVASTLKSDAGPRTLAVTLNGVDGPAVDSGLQDWRRKVFETNPSGGAAWSAADVNAARVGVRVVT